MSAAGSGQPSVCGKRHRLGKPGVASRGQHAISNNCPLHDAPQAVVFISDVPRPDAFHQDRARRRAQGSRDARPERLVLERCPSTRSGSTARGISAERHPPQGDTAASASLEPAPNTRSSRSARLAIGAMSRSTTRERTTGPVERCCFGMRDKSSSDSITSTARRAQILTVAKGDRAGDHLHADRAEHDLKLVRRLAMYLTRREARLRDRRQHMRAAPPPADLDFPLLRCSDFRRFQSKRLVRPADSPSIDGNQRASDCTCFIARKKKDDLCQRVRLHPG